MGQQVSFSQDGNLLAIAMTTYVNRWAEKPCDIVFEDLDKDGNEDAMMLQQLSSAWKKKAYVSGDFIGAWAFAIYIKVDASDSHSRFAAVDVLNSLYDWMSHKDDLGQFCNLPEIDNHRSAIRIEMTGSPDRIEKSKDGTDTYQAIFELEYIYRR